VIFANEFSPVVLISPELSTALLVGLRIALLAGSRSRCER